MVLPACHPEASPVELIEPEELVAMTVQCRNSTTGTEVAVHVEPGGKSVLEERGFTAESGGAEIKYSSSYGDVLCTKTPSVPEMFPVGDNP